MSTLATLKKVCAAYHRVATSALTVDSVDLFLEAANNVRRNAELLHNFEYARCIATLDVNGVTGGSLDDADIDDGTTDGVVVSGTLTPDITGTFAYAGTSNSLAVYTRVVGGVLYTIYQDGTNYVITNILGGAFTFTWTKSATSVVTGNYTAGGSAAGTATVAAGSSAFVRVKEVVAVSRMRPDGTFIPLDFARSDIPIERDRTELEFSDNLFPYLRYPSDAQINARGTSSSMIQRGRKIEIHPYYAGNESTTFNVRLEAYGWLADYNAASLTLTDDPDFFVRYGYNFMQWSIINELNFLFKTFVQREEGNLGAPEQKASDAWRDLLLWDTYQVDSNTTRSR